METAGRLETVPSTSEAWREGKLSDAQAREIASAASVDPPAESKLVAAAATRPLAELAERCRHVRAAAVADEKARHDALHRSRYLRTCTGADGAFRMDLTTPEAGAAILAGPEPFEARVFDEARAAGLREGHDAYAADAMVAMATVANAGTSASGSSAVVDVRVDASVLERGHVEGEETCDIPGIGPGPVGHGAGPLGRRHRQAPADQRRRRGLGGPPGPDGAGSPAQCPRAARSDLCGSGVLGASPP